MDLAHLLKEYDIVNIIGVFPTTALYLKHKTTLRTKKVFIKETNTVDFKHGKPTVKRVWQLDNEKNIRNDDTTHN